MLQVSTKLSKNDTQESFFMFIEKNKYKIDLEPEIKQTQVQEEQEINRVEKNETKKKYEKETENQKKKDQKRE